MITGERGQRAAAMMVGEVDSRETADAVKRFGLELRGYCKESSSTERRRPRPLNRILEAAKIRREPKRAPSEQNAVFGTGGKALDGLGAAARALRAAGETP